nr:DUF3426 domain-containing protein [uncultured Albidiferax sp.]
MALITRCPVCGTLFKVVPDQLRISEGWVRCGHCAEIFDASGDLQQSFAEHPEVQPVGSLPEVLPPPPIALFPPVPPAVELPPEPVYLPEPVLQVAPEPEPVLEAETEPPEPLEDTVPLPAPVVEEVPYSPLELPPEPVVDGGYSFTREPPSEAALPRPVRRGLWMAAAVLLVVALGLQGIFQGRDRLATTWPETRPWLQAICARLGCTVQALRQIDAIVIDSSTLSALQNEDAYRLNLVLKNQATLDVAMPAIEFVLTDIDEQAVFRRVLTPAELGAASRVLFAGREWATSVDVRVIDNPNKGRIVGYRLLAFYP